MRRRTLAHLFDGRGVSAEATARRRGAVGRLRGDKRGGVAIIAAMAATSLLGIAGLTVEVGGWYVLRRNMQAAADAAAIAGALNFDASKSASGAAAAAQSVASRNGFVHGQSGNAVTVASEPATGRVTVTVERPSTGVLLRAAGFGNSTRTISANGVARVVDAGAPPCVLTTTGPVNVGNNTDITAPNCALASNSAAADAFNIGSGGSTGNGSGRITAANIITHGGCDGCAESLGDKLTLTRSPVASSYAPKTENAYAALSSWSPPAVGCKALPSDATNGVTVQPGCYTGISNQPNRTINLAPGVYYLRGNNANLDIKGNLTCTDCTPASGVSIVLVGNGRAAPGTVSIGSQGKIELNASSQPTQPELNGVVIYRHNPGGSPANKAEIDFSAGATVKLNGAVVAPNSGMSMGGNSATSPQSCNIFVVATTEFKGNTHLSAEGCDMYGTARNVPRIARLVE